jgi:NAD(P)-dependent dehydrogenase (short-subunit alcohol dehydrogenase family)
VIDVHLNGAATVTRAVWDGMRDHGYGRILMTGSSSGLYGNFGQASYGAAKLGLAGFAKTLSIEGAKSDIRVNTIVPVAATRMTEDVLPDAIAAAFSPENVVPAALYLVSDGAPTNMIVGAGAGLYHAAYVTMTEGVLLPEDDRTPEGIAASWEQIVDRTGERVPQAGQEHTLGVIARLLEVTPP